MGQIEASGTPTLLCNEESVFNSGSTLNSIAPLILADNQASLHPSSPGSPSHPSPGFPAALWSHSAPTRPTVHSLMDSHFSDLIVLKIVQIRNRDSHIPAPANFTLSDTQHQCFPKQANLGLVLKSTLSQWREKGALTNILIANKCYIIAIHVIR